LLLLEPYVNLSRTSSRIHETPVLDSTNMSNPQEAWKQLQRMANRAGRSAGGPSPRGMGAGLAGLVLLGGAIFVGNNALFNVDGGHRAIKYTRIGGVGKEIYNEGMSSPRGTV
jgi:hypothetical protein